VDQTGSEESKQPAGESGTPSEDPAGEHRASGEHSEQEDGPERARRAFDLLERFSGELEEILQALERTRGGAAPAEERPPVPERAFRPPSIHFDSSPISTRIDPYGLPPVESPGTTARPAPRLLLEAFFLILVAAISARTGQSPLLIVAAEVVAFVIVFSIELALAREKRRVQRFPAAAPLFAAPDAREAMASSGATSVTLDQVEPLVWGADWQEAGAEADWPLVAYELPSEAEDTEEAQEGATEISDAKQPEAEAVVAPEPAPEARSDADLESAAPISIAEPESEVGLEPEAELEPEVEPESIPEIFGAEVEPARPRRFHLLRREAKALEPEMGPEAETVPEVEPEVEIEPSAAVESPAEVVVEEGEPAQPRRFHLFRHNEKALETEIEPEAEMAPEVEPEVEAESPPEAIAEESEPERPRRFHLLRREASETGDEPEAKLESSAEIFGAEVEPEPPRRFHLFRHEEKMLDAEMEHEVAAKPEGEPQPGLDSPPADMAKENEPERPRRVRLFRHEADEPEIEPSAEEPSDRDDSLDGAPRQSPFDEPVRAAETVEMTVEIDLPPEIATGEIEHTFEDLGRREPGRRRRRWPLGAGAGSDLVAPAREDETADDESEVRFAAEQERRRREREYLRKLRVSR